MSLQPPPQESDRARLLQLLLDRSFRLGDFILSSGARSSYYVDARQTTMSGEGQLLIGRLGLATLKAAGWKPRCIGGLTLGADPIAYAIAHTAAQQGQVLDAFTVRKQPKGHGTQRLIEGPLQEGDSVVVVEDVITTGESALRALHAVTAAGAIVLGMLALVDRGEGGCKRIESEGHTVQSLFTAAELSTVARGQ